MDINGGTVNVGQMLGLGWAGGIGFVNVNDGGVLDLFQLHGDGASSMKNGSILDITGTGQVLLPGNYTNVINAYVANGSIYGNGVLGNINIDVSGGVTTITAVPEPSTVLLLGLGAMCLGAVSVVVPPSAWRRLIGWGRNGEAYIFSAK